ncbi:oligosaccharide flippase family protein [Rapidithrix thailandica]|uniref:Oligosaccharide flippase family protein n=1 Tax=Rapidithrix thailandica TaxID=413964 RepID=A0AAW9SK83_9BACT
MITLIKNKIQGNIGELVYLLGQYSTPIVSFLINTLVMRYIAPETLGIHQSIMLWTSYLSFLQLGVFNGLNRNLAYYKGANEEEKLRKASSTGFVFSFCVSVVSIIIVILIYNTSSDDQYSEISFLAYVLLGLTVFTQPIITFFDTLYRTGQDFKKLGGFISTNNAIYLANSLLMFFFGYVGFVIQSAIKLAIALILRTHKKIFFLRVKFSKNSFKEQITTGFPILLNSYLSSTFFIFDQFYITHNFDKIELGYYNLARLVLFIIPVIPNSLTTIFYPKASTLYGKSGKNKQVLKPFFVKSLLINLLIVFPLIGLVYITIEPVVNLFLPKYVSGIEYAKASVLGGLGYIFVGPSVILGVLKSNKINFVLLAGLSTSTYGLYFINILEFGSIINLIYYKNLLFIGYSIFMICYVYYKIK